VAGGFVATKTPTRSPRTPFRHPKRQRAAALQELGYPRTVLEFHFVGVEFVGAPEAVGHVEDAEVGDACARQVGEDGAEEVLPSTLDEALVVKSFDAQGFHHGVFFLSGLGWVVFNAIKQELAKLSSRMKR
jgi:hypothetical protein